MRLFPQQIGAFMETSGQIPPKYRANIKHIYAEICWIGVLSGSVIAFISIYATRLGATGSQIGFLTAAPAVVSLFFALPASAWIARWSSSRVVFWSAMISRFFYLFLIPLPSLFLPESQIWLIILITLVINIPGTALNIGFNTLFAEAVPVEQRAMVVGIRNGLLSIITTVVTLICGYILVNIDFPGGYQVVFAIGFLGAIMSSIHLGFIRSVKVDPCQEITIKDPTSEAVSEEMLVIDSAQKKGSQRFKSFLGLLHLEIMRGSFGKVAGLLFFFHLTQYLVIPLHPVYSVRELGFTDQIISIGGAVFNITVFFGSLLLMWLTRKLGNKRLLGLGVVMLFFFPFLLAFAHAAYVYYLLNFIGGAAWAMVSGALFNYLLEKASSIDRQAYMAWYTVVLNLAILIGSVAGPIIGDMIGIQSALIIFAVGRLLAGAAIFRWG
jgi:MFS family permease